MPLNGHGVLLNLRVFEDAGIEDIEFYLTDEYFPGLIGGSLDVAHSDVDVLFGSHAASGNR